jgi:hypothetical protein
MLKTLKAICCEFAKKRMYAILTQNYLTNTNCTAFIKIVFFGKAMHFKIHMPTLSLKMAKLA